MNKFYFRGFIFFIFFISTYSDLQAQLVNIEEQRKDLKSGIQGLINFSFNINQNTRFLTKFNNTLAIQYTYKQSTLLVLNDISFLRLIDTGQNIDIINKNFQHIRYNYNFKKHDNLTYEFFIQRQQNKIKFIKYRFLTGTGFRIRVFSKDNSNLFIGSLLMYEYEILSDSSNLLSKVLKGDFYISANIKISDLVDLVHVTYYQPALYNLSSQINFELIRDFRLSSETDINFKILNNHVSFSVNLIINYDSRPPAPLSQHPLFYSINNKLTFKF